MLGVCIICGAPREVALGAVDDPITGEQFSIERCTACGLGHTCPQPEDLGRYYGTEYHGGRHSITADLADARRVGCVEKVCGPRRTLSVLDVGCGDGTFLLASKKRGWNVTGTEFNPRIAREKGLEVFERIEDAAPRGPFEVITFWHTLEHMRDPKQMLAFATTLLAPGGSVIIAVPNAGSLQAKVFGAGWFHLDVPRHLFHFSPSSLEQLLSATGLRQTHRWTQEFEIGLFGWTQSVLNRVMDQPNTLFSMLTGRKVPVRAAVVSTIAGAFVTAAAIPLEAAAAVRRSTATMILAATRA